MFGRKKEAKKAPPAARSRRDPDSRATKLSALGLMDVPSLDELEDNGGDAGDDEAALEAELAQLMRGTEEAESRARKRQVKKPAVDLNAMVADCMRDIPSDEDDDGAGMEDDPDLMAELEEMREMEAEMQSPKVLGAAAAATTISYPTSQQVIEPAGFASAAAGPSTTTEPEMKLAGGSLLASIDERISNYVAAQEQAKVSGDASRARRFARGLTTLQQLRRRALNGQAINEDDIPPAVVVRKAEPPVVPAGEEKENKVDDTPEEKKTDQTTTKTVAPAQEETATLPVQPERVAAPSSPRQEEHPDIARLRQRREEVKAAALKARTDGDKAGAVAGLAAVKECDGLIKKIQSGELAGVEALPEIKKNVPEAVAPAPTTTAAPPAVSRQFSRDDPISLPENPEEIPAADPAAVFGAPPPPGSVKEALEQRLAKYRHDEAKAKADGNGGKARRLGRICKQYEDAMKAHKAGRPIPVEDLPTPPGFAPIPTAAAAVTPAAAANPGTSVPPSRSPSDPAASGAKKPSPAAAKPAPRTNRDKQIALLLSQQQQFKAAALEAKKSGQIEQAKEYLR